jgi:hypothetical protein
MDGIARGGLRDLRKQRVRIGIEHGAQRGQRGDSLAEHFNRDADRRAADLDDSVVRGRRPEQRRDADEPVGAHGCDLDERAAAAQVLERNEAARREVGEGRMCAGLVEDVAGLQGYGLEVGKQRCSLFGGQRREQSVLDERVGLLPLSGCQGCPPPMSMSESYRHRSSRSISINKSI